MTEKVRTDYPLYVIGPKHPENGVVTLKDVMTNSDGSLRVFLDSEEARKEVYRSRKLCVYEILLEPGSMKEYR